MKEKRIKEVEDEMEILQLSLENGGGGEGGGGGKVEGRMTLSGKSWPQDLQDRRGNRMDLYEYCMI